MSVETSDVLAPLDAGLPRWHGSGVCKEMREHAWAVGATDFDSSHPDYPLICTSLAGAIYDAVARLAELRPLHDDDRKFLLLAQGVTGAYLELYGLFDGAPSIFEEHGANETVAALWVAMDAWKRCAEMEPDAAKAKMMQIVESWVARAFAPIDGSDN